MNGSGHTVFRAPTPAENWQFPPANLLICKVKFQQLTKKKFCQLSEYIRNVVETYCNGYNVAVIVEFDKSFVALAFEPFVTFGQDLFLDFGDTITNVHSV